MKFNWGCDYVACANLDLALRLVKLMTLKEHMSGEAPNFTNHARHETQMMRETVPKILNTIINIFKFQERMSLSLINFVHNSRDLQCKKDEYSGSPPSPRFNVSMIDTIEDPREELCLKHQRCTCWNQHGADCSDGKKGHNSLNWNAFWVNEDLVGKKISCTLHWINWLVQLPIWTERKIHEKKGSDEG